MKVKSHVGNPYNGRADELADRGARGEVCPSERLYPTDLVLRKATAYLREHSIRFNPPPARATRPQDINVVNQKLVQVGKVILDIVSAHLPKPPPKRPYISTVCLEYINERNICVRNYVHQRFNELNKLICRQAARDREIFGKHQIENLGWPGVNLCRPFIPKP